MGSCMEELWPSFKTSESDGVWKREGAQEELWQDAERARFRKMFFKYVDIYITVLMGMHSCYSTCQVRTVHEC